jgi:DNA-directed RNA polymerase subunit D
MLAEGKWRILFGEGKKVEFDGSKKGCYKKLGGKMGKIKILSESDEKIRFIFEGDVKFANAIRRYAMSRVPVFAIDKVIFYENKSAFFDEYIAHRLGLLPITSPDNVDPEKVGFYLDAIGPAKVYSQDLLSNNEKVKVAFNDIPIITLAEGQSIRLEAYIRKGIGREHMKFQASITSYKQIDDNKFEFFIESLGHMKAKDILIKALNEMDKDLDSLSKSLNIESL